MKKLKRLSKEFAPSHYQLLIKPDVKKMSLSGQVLITGRKINRPSKRITLHQKNLQIKSAKLYFVGKQGVEEEKPISRINHLRSRDEVRLHSDELLFPGIYKLEISYVGRINQQMHGVYVCNYDDGQKQLLATQFESHHAREAFPCIDEPAAKATFELSVITDYPIAISNTELSSAVESQDGKKYVFNKTPLMSTYLLAFVLGDLKHLEATSSSGIKIRSFATAPNSHMLDYSLEVAAKCLDFFENYFDLTYPLPKLDLVALPDFSAGAMENWGLMTFRESCMLVDPISSAIETKQFVAIIVAHEISHQWFGNLVTMEWWDDLWLNESFASLMEYLAVEHIHPEWRIWEHFITHDMLSALYRDCLPNVQPVVTTIDHPDEINSLFDPSIVYAKGASLLYMLMNHIGPDTFKSGIRGYLKKHAYKNTIADNLWESLGTDVKEFMQQWLLKPGYPVVSTEVSDGKLKLSQNRLVVGDANESGDNLWPVPVAIKGKHGFILRDKVHEIEWSNESPMIINSGAKSYFISEYKDDAYLKVLLDDAKDNKLDLIDRLMLLQNAILLERCGRLETWKALEMTEYYSQEKEEPVWSAVFSILAPARRLVALTSAELNLKNFTKLLTEDLVDFVGWDSKESDSSQLLRLRGSALSIAAWSGNERVIKEGLKRFDKFNVPADLPADIRSSIYFIGIRFGSKNNFDKLMRIYNHSNISEDKEDLINGLTSSTDRISAEKLFDLALSGMIKPQDVPSLYAQLLANPYTSEVAWNWQCDNWQWIVEKFAGDKSYDSFPRIAGSIFTKPDQHNRYREFFGHLKDQPALKRAITLGLEEIEGKLKWRDKNEQPLFGWLSRVS